MCGMANPAIRPLLCEVYAADYGSAQAATYVRIFNPDTKTVDLAGWQVDWNGHPTFFPARAALAPGGSACVAYDAAAYRAELGHAPAFAVRTAPDVATMSAPAGVPPALAAEGGMVRLVSPGGEMADAVAWGDAPAPAGWSGPVLPAVDAGGVAVGGVHQRALDEATLGPDCPGRFVTAVGEAAAWRQGVEWTPRRIPRAGQGAFPIPAATAAGGTLFVAPDSAFSAVTAFLDAAERTLEINLYLLTHGDVAARVEAAFRRGVAVRLLAEGQPVEGFTAPLQSMMHRLEDAGVQVRLMRAAGSGYRRYHYNHAKYAVADGRYVLVMSDNWTHDSLPVRPQTGKRGWGAVLDCPALAAHLARVFEFDYDPHSPDSQVFDPFRPLEPGAGHKPQIADQAASPPRPLVDPVLPKTLSAPVAVVPVIAPEHALLETVGIPAVIRSARATLDVVNQTVQLFWGDDPASSPEARPNLLLAELIAAARRGVRVRLLMSGAYQNGTDPRSNTRTRQYLADLAARERLPLEARLLDPATTGMGVHDKGLIADGERVLISSINWSMNSPLYNREMGIMLDGSEAADYFTKVFDRDWADAI